MATRVRFFADEVFGDLDVTTLLQSGEMRAEVAFRCIDDGAQSHKFNRFAVR
jgi:hypothetical protein